MKTLMLLVIIAAVGVGVEKDIGLPTAKITVKAVDELGQPVPGATVTIGFEPAVPQWGGSATINTQGETDKNGEFSASGRSLDTLGAGIQKQGYYAAWPKAAKFNTSLAGMWQPWNPTIEAVLKKVVNPIPMYAKAVRTTIPVQNQEFGYDMEAGDWVAPAGKGKINDLIFKFSGTWNSFKDNDCTLTLTFSNQGDGIQPIIVPKDGPLTMLRLPRTAPDAGYQPKLELRYSVKVQPDGFEKTLFGPNPDMNYFVRVRTTLDSEGKVVSANYGKIHGDIQFGQKSLRIESYYLNPTPGDRNVEFDLKKNLFGKLSVDENVNNP